MSKTCWRKLLKDAVEDGPIIHCTLSEEELDRAFDDGYGGHEGAAFTAWTETRVYFPIVYDGAEWVGSAPRNPCDEATAHMGGE